MVLTLPALQLSDNVAPKLQKRLDLDAAQQLTSTGSAGL